MMTIRQDEGAPEPKDFFLANELQDTMREMQRTHQPCVVRLWAPPGVGKSTNMAAIFNILKFKGLRAEMSPEVAKKHTYENNRMALTDPFYVAACQEYQNFMLRGQVDYIITDSPPELALLYCLDHDAPEMFSMVRHFRQRYRNIDVRLTRDPSRAFQVYGRNHTELQSKALENKLDGLLAQFTNRALVRLADNTAAADIVAWVERELIR
jgi:hypothetical protein